MEWTEEARREVRRRVRYDHAYTLSMEEVLSTLVRQVDIQLHHGLDPATSASVAETLAEIRELVTSAVRQARARVADEYNARNADQQTLADDQAIAAANGERVA